MDQLRDTYELKIKWIKGQHSLYMESIEKALTATKISANRERERAMMQLEEAESKMANWVMDIRKVKSVFTEEPVIESFKEATNLIGTQKKAGVSAIVLNKSLQKENQFLEEKVA
jgi:hypothetical protein